jgi:peptide/nickel transport system permease protein
MAGDTSSTMAAAAPKGRRPNPRLDQIKRTWYFFRRNSLAMIGLGIIVFFMIVYVYAPFYPAPGTSLQTYTASNGQPPVQNGPFPEICTYQPGEAPPAPNCYQTPLGMPSVVGPTVGVSPAGIGPLPFGSLTLNPATTPFFNTFAGLLKGTDWSISISVGIVATGALIGVLLGVVSGYFGGIVDETIMRVTDIFLSIPGLLLVIIFLAIFGISVQSLELRILIVVAAFVIIWWPIYARIVRGQVLVTREQRYVEAARASGASSGRILRKHIIPNSVYPVFVQMSLDVGTIPLLIAAIVFIGFKVFPTNAFPEWGTMTALSVQSSVLESFITNCQTTMGSCIIPWWQFFFPGFTLFLFAISVNFMADGLRDAFDPRLRR